MDKNLDLNDSANLPQSDAGIEGGDYGVAVGKAALRQGFSRLESSHDDANEYAYPKREDCDGSTYVGNPDVMGGFLNRPRGWER